MDARVVGIEPERAGIAFAQCEGGCCFGRVVEPAYLREGGGAVLLLDVAQDAAGADGGELLVIADQADTPPRSAMKRTAAVEGRGGCLAGLVDDDQHRSGQLAPARPLATARW